jgi:hypothetical protein
MSPLFPAFWRAMTGLCKDIASKIVVEVPSLIDEFMTAGNNSAMMTKWLKKKKKKKDHARQTVPTDCNMASCK